VKNRAALEPLLILVVAALAACASTRAPTVVHTMPSDPAFAMGPSEARPTRPAELAEGALNLLNPERPGGPDYVGAARLCLLAAEAADSKVEKDLQRSCFRLAARSALRSGDRDLYLQAVDTWVDCAPRNERAAGELAIHMALRDRLRGVPSGVRLAPDVRRLLPDPADGASAVGAGRDGAEW